MSNRLTLSHPTAARNAAPPLPTALPLRTACLTRHTLRQAVPKLLRAFNATLPMLTKVGEADVRRVMAFFSSAAALHMNVEPFKDIGAHPLESKPRALCSTGVQLRSRGCAR